MNPRENGISLSVLGPVRASRGGEEFHVGGPQRQAGLALLLAADGRPVPLEVFVDALWRGDPPASAANVVHRLISGLRRALEPGRPARSGGGLIARGTGGYRLTAVPGTLDLTRFREAVRRGRALAEAGETVAAAEMYATGLALWHGPAGTGLDPGVRAHPQLAALDREWAAAAREAADLARPAGAAERLLPLVARAAGAHPLDESLQARLVLLLSASGRRAAALDTFASVRRRLADELGLDPDPELRAAHRDALVTSGPAARRPAELPARPAVFAGRAAELARLTELAGPTAAVAADGSMPVIVVGGMAGAGKSALAVHWAHAAAPGFPDGQLYCDLGGDADPAEVLRGFLTTLGVPAPEMPAGVAGRATLFRSLLSGRRVLVLLDDARDAAQVRPLLPGSAGCLVLVTSRNPMTALVAAAGARTLRLDVLGEADAHALLAARIGGDRVRAEPAAVRQLVAACGRLPLALAIVAARAAVQRARRLADLAAEVRGADGLDAFATGEDGPGLRDAFAASYRSLSPDAARLFRRLVLAYGPEVPVALAAAVAGTDERAARGLLRELAGAQLVSESRPGRYTLNGLLRAYADEVDRATGDTADRAAAARRILDHYLLLAAGTAPPPVDALLAAFRLGGDQGRAGPQWRLARALTPRLHEQRRWADAIRIGRAALDTAVRAGDRWWTGHLHEALGRGYLGMGRPAQAREHFEQAVALAAPGARAGLAACAARTDDAARHTTARPALVVPHLLRRFPAVGAPVLVDSGRLGRLRPPG